MTKSELEKSLNFDLGDKFLLVTFHPVTMEDNTAEMQCENLLKALEEVNSEYKLLFTLPNSDTNGRVIIKLVKEFVEKDRENRYSITSLGKHRYFSALKYASAVIGNSSSGLVEAPSFHIPTLNIGNRQKGRAHGASVMDVPATFSGIKKGLRSVLSKDFQDIAKEASNPYEKKGTLDTIYYEICNHSLDNLIPKKFYNL